MLTKGTIFYMTEDSAIKEIIEEASPYIKTILKSTDWDPFAEKIKEIVKERWKEHTYIFSASNEEKPLSGRIKEIFHILFFNKKFSFLSKSLIEFFTLIIPTCITKLESSGEKKFLPLLIQQIFLQSLTEILEKGVHLDNLREEFEKYEKDFPLKDFIKLFQEILEKEEITFFDQWVQIHSIQNIWNKIYDRVFHDIEKGSFFTELAELLENILVFRKAIQNKRRIPAPLFSQIFEKIQNPDFLGDSNKKYEYVLQGLGSTLLKDSLPKGPTNDALQFLWKKAHQGMVQYLDPSLKLTAMYIEDPVDLGKNEFHSRQYDTFQNVMSIFFEQIYEMASILEIDEEDFDSSFQFFYHQVLESFSGIKNIDLVDKTSLSLWVLLNHHSQIKNSKELVCHPVSFLQWYKKLENPKELKTSDSLKNSGGLKSVGSLKKEKEDWSFWWAKAMNILDRVMILSSFQNLIFLRKAGAVIALFEAISKLKTITAVKDSSFFVSHENLSLILGLKQEIVFLTVPPLKGSSFYRTLSSSPKKLRKTISYWNQRQSILPIQEEFRRKIEEKGEEYNKKGIQIPRKLVFLHFLLELMEKHNKKELDEKETIFFPFEGEESELKSIMQLVFDSHKKFNKSEIEAIILLFELSFLKIKKPSSFLDFFGFSTSKNKAILFFKLITEKLLPKISCMKEEIKNGKETEKIKWDLFLEKKQKTHQKQGLSVPKRILFFHFVMEILEKNQTKISTEDQIFFPQEIEKETDSHKLFMRYLLENVKPLSKEDKEAVLLIFELLPLTLNLNSIEDCLFLTKKNIEIANKFYLFVNEIFPSSSKKVEFHIPENQNMTQTLDPKIQKQIDILDSLEKTLQDLLTSEKSLIRDKKNFLRWDVMKTCDETWKDFHIRFSNISPYDLKNDRNVYMRLQESLKKTIKLIHTNASLFSIVSKKDFEHDFLQFQKVVFSYLVKKKKLVKPQEKKYINLFVFWQNHPRTSYLGDKWIPLYRWIHSEDKKAEFFRHFDRFITNSSYRTARFLQMTGAIIVLLEIQDFLNEVQLERKVSSEMSYFVQDEIRNIVNTLNEKIQQIPTPTETIPYQSPTFVKKGGQESRKPLTRSTSVYEEKPKKEKVEQELLKLIQEKREFFLQDTGDKISEKMAFYHLLLDLIHQVGDLQRERNDRYSNEIVSLFHEEDEFGKKLKNLLHSFRYLQKEDLDAVYVLLEFQVWEIKEEINETPYLFFTRKNVEFTKSLHETALAGAKKYDKIGKFFTKIKKPKEIIDTNNNNNTNTPPETK